MTKHGVVLEDGAAARHFSFPPPRTTTVAGGGDSCRKLSAQVDLGPAVVGSWLDSMKASSPRHRLMAPLPGTAADAEHDDWMERHPSALDRFDALVAAAKGKQVAVFLDYDGTLSPIVEDPDRAVMTDEVRALLLSVSSASNLLRWMDEKAEHALLPSSNNKKRNKQNKEMRIPVANSDADDVCEHADEGRGARRGGALPDSDRQRAVPGQGVQLRAAGGALLRREPRDGHPRAHRRPQPPRQGGVVGAVPAGERVPAGDGGGVRGAGVAGGAVHPGRQGGEQQVLPVGALPVRGGARVGAALRAGPRRAQGLPGPAPHAGPQGAGGPPHDPLGQGQGPRVPAQRPRLRRRRQRRRVPHLRRRRPHRRGRVPGAARARAGRRHPRVQVPQGDQRVLHAPGPRRGQGVPAQARRRQRQHQLILLRLIRFPPCMTNSINLYRANSTRRLPTPVRLHRQRISCCNCISISLLWDKKGPS